MTEVIPPREWETARLFLRPAAREAADALFADYACDAEVTKYMTWRPHTRIDETVTFLRRCEAAWEQGTAFPWTLWAKHDGSFMGMLECRVRGWAMDLGYALRRCWWRQGFMSEAVGGLVRWGLEQPQLLRIWAVCDIENVGSARVLERAGLQREGVLRRWLVHPNMGDAPRDCACYSIVK